MKWFIANFIWREVKHLTCGIGIKERFKCVFSGVLVREGDTINFRFNPFKFDEEEISMEMFEKKLNGFE